MVPVRLKLKNFMSYKEMEEPLDFSSIHTACLTGGNGQGKSTLLDAMTWAIWGKARAKRSDDLVRLGEEEAQVEFEFNLGHDLYRLIRTRNIKGRGKTNLEFQIFDESQGKYRSLTDRSVRETQEKIINTLRMDYDTFVNSAFILQGKADSFTLKTPSSRKEVLAEILNLKTYDLLEKKSRRLRRKAETQIQILTKSIEEINKELEHKQGYETDYRKYESQLKKARQIIEQYEKRVETLRATENDLSKKSTELEKIREQIVGLEKDFGRLSDEINVYKNKIKEYELILAKKDEIESKYEELIKHKQKEEELAEKEKIYKEFTEQKRIVETKIEDARHQLDKDIASIIQKIEALNERKTLDEGIMANKENIEAGFSELEKAKQKEKELEKKQEEVYGLEKDKVSLEKVIEEKRYNVLSEKQRAEEKFADIERQLSETEGVEDEIAEIKEKLEKLESDENKLLDIKEAGGRLRAQIAHLQKLNEKLDTELDELHEKQHLMSHADAKCPLCNSELSEEQRNELTDKFKINLTENENQKKKNQKEIKALEKKIREKTKEYKAIEKTLPRIKNYRNKIAQLEVIEEKRRALLKQKPRVKREITKNEKILKEKKFAKEEIKQLEKIIAKIKEINYNRDEHNEIRAKITALSHFNNQKIQLDNAIEEYERIQMEFPDWEAQLDEKRRQYAEEDYAIEEHKEKSQIEAKIQELDYNSVEHENLRRRIKTLADYEVKKVKLEQAHRLLAESQKELENVEYTLESKRSEKGKLISEEKALTEQVKELPKINREIKDIERKLISARRDEAMNRTSLGRMQERLQYCMRLEEQRKEKVKILDGEKEKKGLYLDLSYAFSKKGIQAFIIENAIPDIEMETNRILQRITENRMVVKIETQKMTQGGDASETLDITISDELGTRPYEVFSGGEAFRINFAIRLALSKLLSKRAGARLQTLVIDEGFGTQDAAAKERLVEVLNAISDEFEKILVITHLEDLQDMFPARIEVTKTERQGSKAVIF